MKPQVLVMTVGEYHILLLLVLLSELFSVKVSSYLASTSLNSSISGYFYKRSSHPAKLIFSPCFLLAYI